MHFLRAYHIFLYVPVWTFNSLLNDKILGMSELKAFADDKIPEEQKFVFGRIENIVGKGENADYQQFLLFPVRIAKLVKVG